MRSGNVVLNDNFRVRIYSFDSPYKSNCVARVPLRILRISDHKRELRNDAETPNARRKFQRLVRAQALIHLLQSPIRSRFGAEENHGGPGATQQAKRLVRVTQDRVNTSLGPPVQFQRGQLNGKFSGMALIQEKIVVIK